MTDKPNVDPILVSVIANRLDAITKEIGMTMLRTSRSPIFSEARDFVTAIFDHKLRWVAQTGYIPVIAGTTSFSQKAIAQAFEGEIYEGDVFVLNDVYSGNNQPPDFAVTKPVFWKGELRFWAMAKGHHADSGGGGVAGYNPEAKDIWEDCLRIPPAKLYDRGKYNKQIWNFILYNMRVPFLVEGDLHCQVGAATVGERALLALLDKYGPETLEAAIDEWLAASEAHMRRELRQIPNGAYSAERKIDHDGVDKDKMVTIRLNVVVEDEDITFDFTGSDPQVRGFINSPYPNTVSSSYLALFSCLDPDLRMNDGSTKPVKVVAPEGSVVNCLPPVPTSADTVPTCETICEAGWLALSQAIPGQVQAPWARWCAPASAGINPRLGRPFAEIHFMSKGGGGATEGFDGWDHVGTVVCLGGLRSPDPELHELVTPYRISKYEYWPDSAGPGRWRGGMGVKYRWACLADGIPFANFGSGMRDETAPLGIMGGKGAPKSVGFIQRPDGTVVETDANTFYAMNSGDEWEIWNSGGGGFGNPLERPPERVLDDVLDELVSIEAARRDYGVAIDPQTMTINWEETKKLRGL
ncbi:MAG: hydantoinase B/oxoprolinase family protein [Chloroflexi bacterium]|nr:hydantoinase B/oxoprolinase family protein [Chloroflexota bacterium]MDA8188053.1 hydantoinase B/oxoprolinase family protein [Dehalococcoidales bacterium]